MQVGTASTQPDGFATGIRTRLEGLGLPVWGAVLAFLGGLLTFLVTSGGLFILIPWVQSAIVAGIVVGLTSPKIRVSALVGSLVGLLGAMYAPENFFNHLFNFTPAPPALSAVVVLGAAVVCGGMAAVATLLKDQSKRLATVLVTLAVLVLIVNLWFTPTTLNAVSSTRASGIPLNAFNDQLNGDVNQVLMETDGAFFLHVLMDMEQGHGFYDAYTRVLTAERGGALSVADYRTPVVWTLWRALPNHQSIVLAWLVLATMAILSAVALGLTTVKAPMVIPGVAALTAYFGYFAFNLELLRQDPWAAAVAVLAFSAYGISVRSSKWQAWTWAAVALTVLSVFAREVMGFLLIAGFVSAFFGDKSQRRFRLTAWIAGILVFVAAFGIHAMAAQPFIKAPEAGIPRAGYGSVSFMLIALNYATNLLGRQRWLSMSLAAVGFAGVLMIRDSRVRTYALISTIAPMAAFLVLGNNAFTGVPGGETSAVNYWGVAVVPLLYAAIPFVFSAFPHSGARDSVGAGDGTVVAP